MKRAGSPAHRIASPTSTVQFIGAGSIAPFGSTRPAPSIQTGITGASGNASARRATPAFIGPSSSVAAPRVPSGKMMTMSPAASAARAGANTSSRPPPWRAIGTMPTRVRENQPISGPRRK